MYIWGKTPPVGWEVAPHWRVFLPLVFSGRTQKYAKLMVEPYTYDNLNQICRFFYIFNNNKKKIESHLETSQIGFFRTFMTVLRW